jgi:hypothetical protein
MANRDQETARTSDTPEKADASGVTADSIEQRVVAFAEHLGRIAGTVQARAEGWMDRETLSRQLVTVRDAAAELLEQLAGGRTASKMKPQAAPPRGQNRGRSGGAVDAPGKKHRKPMPTDPGSNTVNSQASKMRTAKTMVKTNRRRGRG